MFGTQANLDRLVDADLFADGTWDSAPKLMTQVYGIHAVIEGKCIPMVYCILPRKTEDM